MKLNLKPFFIAVAAFSVGVGLSYAANAPKATPQAKTSTNKTAKPTQKQAAKPNSEGFVPSAHSGVMVRSVPQKNPHAKTGTSIFRKPGAARPTRALSAGTRSTPTRRQGQSAKGGTAASLPASRMPVSEAHIDKNGKLVLH